MVVKRITWVNQPRVQFIAVMIGFGVIGIITLLMSRAATPPVVTHGANGTTNGNVCVTNDSSSNNNQAITFGCTPSASNTVQFPRDANIIFLADAPYNVKCDGQTTHAASNTTAIQNAFTTHGHTDNIDNPVDRDRRFTFVTLVLPAGNCVIANTIAGHGSAIRLVGAGRNNTFLTLQDNAGSFNNESSPKYILDTGSEYSTGRGTGNANAGFANYVQDLTIDTGVNNPGAMGLRFDGSNSAAVERVTIRARNGSGLRGLSFETAAGSAQIQDVAINGFAVGIWADEEPINNLIFNNVTLVNQRQVAIQNNGKSLQFEKITVRGAPKVYETAGPQAVAVFIDGTFTGSGSGIAIDARRPGNFVYLRAVTAPGWSQLVKTNSGDHFTNKTAIVEWASANYQRGNTAAAWNENRTQPLTLNLPHPAAPNSTNYNLNQWKKALATSNNHNDDDGPAIQAAIDSGARIIYLPYGNYTIKSRVVVHGNVEKIDFFGSSINSANGGKIVVESSTAPFVQIMNASARIPFEQNGPNKVILENMGPIALNGSTAKTGPNATGDLYLENFAASNTWEITKPINVFIRQANREGRPAVISGGARVWIFGDNLEMHDGKNPATTITDSQLEVLAGAMDNLATGGEFNSQSHQGLYDAKNSQLSITLPGVYRGTAITGHAISDKNTSGTARGNVYNTNLVVGPAIGQWKRVVLPLYISP